jgi:hypothetical protein
MNAEVRIHLEERPSALQVPVQALAQYEGRFYSLVLNGDDYVTREVAVGSANDKVAVVERGLNEGDVVVMSPRRAGDLLALPEESPVERPALADAPTRQGEKAAEKLPDAGAAAPAGGAG